MTRGNGRFAPSPSSDLHLGNLRTALVAYLAARSTGRGFVMRVEDLDTRSRARIAQRQLADLGALGLNWDGPVMYQSERLPVYQGVVKELARQGLVYECFCSRGEILDAPRAPHAPPGSYPGTCRELSEAERAARRAQRPGAIRLRSHVDHLTVSDGIHGAYTGSVDDFVVMRADGTPAYNLAVVVDDSAQGVTQVVRGDDLLSSSPRQSYLGHLLGYEAPEYLHVPLVVNHDGVRLSKRDSALAGPALWDAHGGAEGLLAQMGQSLGLAAPGEKPTLAALVNRFDQGALSAEAWIV